VFQVGAVPLPAPVFLAPMSGVTDAAFRTQAAHFDAPAVVTEMVAGSELARKSEEFVRRAAPHSGGGPFIVQLAGREPLWIRVGAELAAAAGADIIDINMGCPAKRVTGGQAGSALMREPGLARELIAAAVAASPKPVTVKMRLGWDEDRLNAPELARIAEGEGASMITVHGRTRNQFYDGQADWTKIRATVEAVSLPVIANGDILDTASARLCLARSGAAGVMVGRGALGRPWRLAEIAAGLEGKAFSAPPRQDRLASMIRQVFDSVELYGEGLGVRVVRKHISAFYDAYCEDEGREADTATRTGLCRLERAADLVEALEAALFEVRLAA
jgi:tRNA-dihydrouridine synthase B